MNNLLLILMALFASFVFAEEQQNDIAAFEQEVFEYRKFSYSEQEQRQLKKTADKIRLSNLSPQVKVSLLLDLYENVLSSPTDGLLITTKGRITSGLIIRNHKLFLELKDQAEFFSLRERYLNIVVGVVSEHESHIIPNYKPPKLNQNSGIDFSEDPEARKLRLEKAQAYTRKKMKEIRLQEELQDGLSYFSSDNVVGRNALKKIVNLFGGSMEEQELLESYMSNIVQPTRAELKRMVDQNDLKNSVESRGNDTSTHSSIDNPNMADMQKEQHSEQSQLAKYTQKEASPKEAEQLIDKGRLKSSTGHGVRSCMGLWGQVWVIYGVRS